MKFDTKDVLLWFRHSWKGLFLLFAPIVTMALPIACDFTSESRCAYVIIIMALFWITEATHITVTSLIPIFAFPLMGVLDSAVVCIQYFKESVALLLGSLLIAALIQHSGLHLRIALNIMNTIGTSVKWIILGMMLTTMLLSMWISNTAVAAMMTPMAVAILQQINQENPGGTEENTTDTTNTKAPEKDCEAAILGENQRNLKRRQKNLSLAMLLSIAYSANIGGTGSLFGTGPNVAFNGQIIEYYGDNTDLSFATWLMFNAPGMIINTTLTWIYLIVFFVGFRDTNNSDHDKVKKVITDRLEAIGPMNRRELYALGYFITAALLWFFREPQFMPGWSDHFTNSVVKDSTPAFLVMVLALTIPVGFGKCEGKEDTYLITWKILESKVPWGLLLMIGAGFAMSEACTASGLSLWIGDQLMVLEALKPEAIVFVVCIIACILTQVVSNSASANILIPVLCPLAEALHMNPLYLTMPAIVTCSYAFILPVATPANAVVYEASKIKTIDMVKVGIGISIICVGINFLMVSTLGDAIFDLHTFPDWAQRNSTGH